jgi:hypothetical protein
MNKNLRTRNCHRLDALAFAGVLLAMFVATCGFVLDAAIADLSAKAAPETAAAATVARRS